VLFGTIQQWWLVDELVAIVKANMNTSIVPLLTKDILLKYKDDLIPLPADYNVFLSGMKGRFPPRFK